jgi:hypothetical protein
MTSFATQVNSDASTPPLPTSADMDLVGFPGFLQHLSLIPHFRDPNDPRNQFHPAGLPGRYKVIFTFCRPGFSPLHDNNVAPAEHHKGDSHLAIAKPAYDEPNLPGADQVVFQVRTRNGEFVFYGHPNEAGFLGKIESEPFNAQSFQDAQGKAFQAIAPALSNISFFLDVPLNIYQTDVVEMRTGGMMLSMVAPFNETPSFLAPSENLPDDYLKYTSFYREAMISNSPNYQFLCYFKVIEGLRKRRERLIVEAKVRGETPKTPLRQLIPKTREEQRQWLSTLFAVPWPWDDFALNMAFPQASLGRRVSDVVQNELTDIRNKIAHSVLDGGEPTISIDHPPDITQVVEWLPLTKCLARYHIKLEFPDVL